MSGVYIFKSDDNVDIICEEINTAYLKGLEGVGLAAEGYAKKNCPVDTGHLRNSITHKVDTVQKCVYIGTNVEYGKYVECGTGRNSAVGGNPLIEGRKPRPFLKPAATDHKSKYNEIIQNALKNG